ncbi:MAG: hypothetical protein ACYTBX_04250 [Planctomycetota bacterium]
MEPAGGETGEPHCLAEVYELPKAALLLCFILKAIEKINASKKSRQAKNRRTNKTPQEVYLHPTLS